MRILTRLFAHVRPHWKLLLLTATAMLFATGGRPKETKLFARPIRR